MDGDRLTGRVLEDGQTDARGVLSGGAPSGKPRIEER